LELQAADTNWKFYCPHTTKGRRLGDSNIPKLLSNEKKNWNNKQKEARVVVEQAFAALEQKWHCLCSPFQEGILALDQVVRVAAATHNISTQYNCVSKKRKRA